MILLIHCMPSQAAVADAGMLISVGFWTRMERLIAAIDHARPLDASTAHHVTRYASRTTAISAMTKSVLVVTPTTPVRKGSVDQTQYMSTKGGVSVWQGSCETMMGSVWHAIMDARLAVVMAKTHVYLVFPIICLKEKHRVNAYVHLALFMTKPQNNAYNVMNHVTPALARK